MGRQPGQLVGPQRIHRDDPLAEALERARYAKNLTMAALAEKSRVSLRTIKDIAAVGSRRRRGSRWTIEKLNAALDCRLYDLARAVEAERAPAKTAKGAKRRRPGKVQCGS